MTYSSFNDLFHFYVKFYRHNLKMWWCAVRHFLHEHHLFVYVYSITLLLFVIYNLTLTCMVNLGYEILDHFI